MFDHWLCNHHHDQWWVIYYIYSVYILYMYCVVDPIDRVTRAMVIGKDFWISSVNFEIETTLFRMSQSWTKDAVSVMCFSK